MPDFKVQAKQGGNSVEFFIEDTTDVKAALALAHEEANRIFDFQGKGEEPTVSVKPIIEKE